MLTKELLAKELLAKFVFGARYGGGLVLAEIIFKNSNGQIRSVEAKNGETLMQVAINSQIEGIDAECGGCLTCSTCHVYVEERVFDKLEAAKMREQDMLDFALDVRGNSRLACQVEVSELLDGTVIEIPKQQA